MEMTLHLLCFYFNSHITRITYRYSRNKMRDTAYMKCGAEIVQCNKIWRHNCFDRYSNKLVGKTNQIQTSRTSKYTIPKTCTSIKCRDGLISWPCRIEISTQCCHHQSITCVPKSPIYPSMERSMWVYGTVASTEPQTILFRFNVPRYVTFYVIV